MDRLVEPHSAAPAQQRGRFMRPTVSSRRRRPCSGHPASTSSRAVRCRCPMDRPSTSTTLWRSLRSVRPASNPWCCPRTMSCRWQRPARADAVPHGRRARASGAQAGW